MITEFDLNAAIAECQGEKNPDARTCMKLAAYYIIKDEMYGKGPEYSHDMPHTSGQIITYDSGTEFSNLISGRNSNEIWAKMDELMSTLQLLNKRLYNSVLNGISEG